MKKHSLCGKWNMVGNGYRLSGQIPGSVYSFLCVDNAILPDPYYCDNEDLYLEASRHDYSFEREFDYRGNNNQVRLVFEGLDTLCEIYLNGELVAKTQNMHIRYDLDVSGRILQGKNCLSVICHSAPQYIKERNLHSKLFGACDCMQGYPHLRKAHCMMGWDWGPRLPDAGIWREVYLLEKDSAEILDVNIVQRHEDGKVYIIPEVETDGGEPRVTLTAPDGEAVTLAVGKENEIVSPRLWWPNGLGEQDLYGVKVELLESGFVVDEKTLRIGLREMKLIRRADEYGESFYHEINGVDMFAMGADYIPEDNILSRITPERTRKLLTECRHANFNTIRVWGGGYYPDDSFFDVCDELGLVVFFDLMFACSVYEPDEKMTDDIILEVERNLARIRHHACLGLVCGNNEIEWHFHDYVSISGREDREHLADVYLDLFERKFPEAVRRVATEVAYIPSSPTSKGGFCDPNGQACGDAHDWDPEYISSRGRFYRYVSEFGFQALPHIRTVEAYTAPVDRSFNSVIMEKHQRSGGGNELILAHLTRLYKYPRSLEELIYASQLTQCRSVGYRVEHMRRHRGRCMGALYWQLNDIWPGTSWSSIDCFGRYKALQYAAKRFFAPILLSCEEIGELQNRGSVNVEKGTYSENYSARLCVTNDTLTDVECEVAWEIRGADSSVFMCGCQGLRAKSLSASWLDKLDLSDVDVHRMHIRYSLSVAGVSVSEGCTLLCTPKHYELQDPCLSLELEDGYITVRSSAFAMAVRIDNAEGDLILSDNYFDMEAGERRLCIISGHTESLSVGSVYDIG